MARILVLDDDPMTLRLMQDVLGKVMKHEVSEANSVESALDHARHMRFDLMFLDQHLPDGSVVDFCHLLSQFQGHQHIPKWVITGENPLKEHSSLWKKLDIAGYLTKPIDIDYVIGITEKCLKK